MDVVVEFDYAAQEVDELNLKKGDVISNVEMVQEGWCQGVLYDKKGMFPDNFVKELKKVEKQELPKKVSHSSQQENIRTKISNAINNPPSLYANNSITGPKKALKQARVTFDYDPLNTDELALQTGQIVNILNEEEPGWWEGSLNGKVGMIPSNFVELITTPSEGHGSHYPGEPPLSSEHEAVPEIKGRKVTGVGFGPNIFGKGEIILKPTNRGLPSTTLSIVTSSSNHNSSSMSSSVAPNKKKPMVLPELETKPDVVFKPAPLKARVIYEYKAENPDELSLHIGDVIQVLDQDGEDAGWWKGEVKGKVGVFPDNFVQLLPQEEAVPRLPLNKPKKPVDPPLNKPSFNALKPKNVFSKPNESQEPIKNEFVVNKGPPKRPPTSSVIKQEASKESLKSPPVLNKVKNWESQEMQEGSNISSSSSATSQPLPHSSPTFASRKNPQPLPQKNTKVQSPSNQVTTEMMGELQRDVEGLKDQLERMKRDNEKNLLNLMSEIDEEKKTRFNMQVEIERLKKLLSSFSTMEHPLSTKAL